jgi:LysR family cys regulon transcriptional activator
MNFRQLRYLCQVVDSGFNITYAARELHTSQPGISKQLAALEQELNARILVRRSNRIVGLTDPGRSILNVARRILDDAQSLHRMSADFGLQDAGRLVVGTTHTHARYVLPGVIRRFSAAHPRVQVVIRQDNESRIAALVSAGEADVGLTVAPPEPHTDLVCLPCYQLPRSVIVRPGHPLLSVKRLSLKEIARYPLISFDAAFAGGRKVLEAFTPAGIRPNVVMSAIDSDVIKSYVELGLGIAVLPTITYLPDRDTHLRARDASHLFEPTVAGLQIRRNHYLLRYVLDFIEELAPQWKRPALTRALESGQVPARTPAVLVAAQT